MFNIIKIWYVWNFLVWFWMKIFPKHTLFSKKNCLKNIHFFACGFERRKSVCFLGSKSRFYAGLRDFFVPGVHLRVHGFITKVDTTEFFCLTSPSPHNPQNRQWEYTYFLSKKAGVSMKIAMETPACVIEIEPQQKGLLIGEIV